MTLTPMPPIVIDTREQAPYAFASISPDAAARRLKNAPYVVAVTTVVRGLPTGDYSLAEWDGFDGSPHGVAIERKSLADLYGTLGQQRGRFQRELERLAAFAVAAVVVEADWATVLNAPACGAVRSKLPPKTIYRSVLAWQQRYPSIHWWFCPSREFAEVTTYRIIERFWRDRQRDAARELTRAADGLQSQPTRCVALRCVSSCISPPASVTPKSCEIREMERASG